MQVLRIQTITQGRLARSTVVFFVIVLIAISGLFIRSVLINYNRQSGESEEPGQIKRVELMPNLPEPFQMRDWRQVARDYDAFVFNFSKTGEYLPLISWDTNHQNFDRDTFSIPSHVGRSPADEAINCMAAVLSATLVGIDKSNQSGYNWVEMCENWYNIDTEQFIYLNNRHAVASSSFWYVLFPNLIFYQLAYYYPEVGDFQNEIRVVANRWYDACVALGGSANPWSLPNFAHTALDFNTMQPVYRGWREPDAAAAVAWLEYIAYLKENDPKYLLAADWCLKFLNKLTYNPLYEVLLPYGAYIAARMNAELGKTYNTHKLINWCFGPGDHQARFGWGVITQKWGDYDCHGLHGSITDGGGYAFAMGTYENVGCLVPIVRYDDRYARAIGKYVLNAANAARLFFGNGLDADHQDGYDWIEVNDPDYCIGYEALRKTWNDKSPFATGDAIKGGWGPTNLGLYGSSHVGIFGGIISPTNDEKILQLDCLITDYYHDEAYPTYLYYNPYDVTKMVEINVGLEAMSLYDTITEEFLATNVSGLASFQLPADSAAVIVVVPVDGIMTYEGTKTLINNITVDYEPVVVETSTTTSSSITLISPTTSQSTKAETSPFSNFLMTLCFLITLCYFSLRKRNT
ncbi:MAG: hypothetical protein JSW11_18070 [Candidatus Heimdallarchaeota archaeon]|nr:MAG: hypothetical protein JSW11_18070 [Candidatus Heimdallarchaeota archaeon]